MFVQVIRGRTTDAAGLRRQSERWRDEVRPGAVGFLGSTVGIADDGTVVAVARFVDAAAGAANSARAEQSAWWEETSKYFDGEPTFRESTDVATLFDGGSDAAGFVQIMEGTADRKKVEALETPELLAQLRTARPDLIGSLRVWFDGGVFLDTAYFTSEGEARQGETSSEFSGPEQEFAEAFGEITFIDIRNPLFA